MKEVEKLVLVAAGAFALGYWLGDPPLPHAMGGVPGTGGGLPPQPPGFIYNIPPPQPQPHLIVPPLQSEQQNYLDQTYFTSWRWPPW